MESARTFSAHEEKKSWASSARYTKYPKTIRPLLCHQLQYTNDDRTIDSAFVFSILFGFFPIFLLLLVGWCSCCCSGFSSILFVLWMCAWNQNSLFDLLAECAPCYTTSYMFIFLLFFHSIFFFGLVLHSILVNMQIRYHGDADRSSGYFFYSFYKCEPMRI